MHYARLSAFLRFRFVLSFAGTSGPNGFISLWFGFLYFSTLALVFFLVYLLFSFLLIIAFFGGLNSGVSCWRQLPI